MTKYDEEDQPSLVEGQTIDGLPERVVVGSTVTNGTLNGFEVVVVCHTLVDFKSNDEPEGIILVVNSEDAKGLASALMDIAKDVPTITEQQAQAAEAEKEDNNDNG